MPQKGNDQRSVVKNPNNPAHQKDLDNQSVQKNVPAPVPTPEEKKRGGGEEQKKKL